MSNEPKTVQLDHLSDRYLLYVEKLNRLKELEAEVAKLRREFETEVGDAEVATIFGEPVITYPRINRFKTTEFKKDNPVLYKQYVRPKVIEEFDADTFRAEHPNLFTQYQSRQWQVKEK